MGSNHLQFISVRLVSSSSSSIIIISLQKNLPLLALRRCGRCARFARFLHAKRPQRRRARSNGCFRRLHHQVVYQFNPLLFIFHFKLKVDRLQIIVVATQVAQARNMSISEHRHYCVTFKI